MTSRRSTQLKFNLLLGLCVLCLSVVVGWMHDNGLWDATDDRVLRKLELLSPHVPSEPAEIVLAPIRDLGGQAWPWSNLDYAIFLHTVAPLRPETVVLMLPLQNQDTVHPIYDRQLARQFETYRGIISSAPAMSAALTATPQPVIENINLSEGTALNLPDYTTADWPMTTLWEPNRMGITAMSGGRSSLGRLPLLIQHRERVVPTLLLAAYAHQLGASLPRTELRQGHEIVLFSVDGRRLARIPIDRQGRMLLRTVHPASSFREMEFYDIVLSAEMLRQGREPLVDLSRIRRSLLITGLEAARTHDPLQTTAGEISMVRLHAQALADLMINRVVYPMRSSHWFAAALLFGALAIWPAAYLRVWMGILLLPFTCLLILATILLVYDAWPMLLSAPALLLLTLLSWAAGLALGGCRSRALRG